MIFFQQIKISRRAEAPASALKRAAGAGAPAGRKNYSSLEQLAISIESLGRKDVLEMEFNWVPIPARSADYFKRAAHISRMQENTFMAAIRLLLLINQNRLGAVQKVNNQDKFSCRAESRHDDIAKIFTPRRNLP
jgi:hypothetical protein